jgi:hypothetical protein
MGADIDAGGCTCRLEGSDYYNANSSSVPVIKAALCAGLYPQVQHCNIIARCNALGPRSGCAGGAATLQCAARHCKVLRGDAQEGLAHLDVHGALRRNAAPRAPTVF